MRYVRFLLPLLVLFPSAGGMAQTVEEVTDLGKPFEADFASGSELRMYLRSGEIHILGGDENRILIRVKGRNADQANEVKVSLRRSGNTGGLHISGGPRNDLEIDIQIPKNANLSVRMPAGALEVRGVTGSKDAELHFGELIIAVGNPNQYARVDASVTSGALDADPFGVSKGGLFRSFKKDGTGSYRLHAHVGAGQLTLH
jgi:hypothetical protein